MLFIRKALENWVKKTKEWYRKLPEKKKYVEFITTLLSVPVMVTVIIINLNNLNQNKNQNASKTSSTASPIQVVITGNEKNQPSGHLSPPPGNISQITVSPSATPTVSQCKKQIGPVDILTPQEGEIITKDNVCIDISTKSEYCPVLWAYQLNGGDWSNFTDKDICLYNLTPGKKELQIKIKSSVSDEIVTIKREFVYQNLTSSPQPTTATSSASVN